MHIGKLPLEHLDRLLKEYSGADSRVVVGPQIGEDATVIDFGRTYLVAKTDPITFVTDDIGWYVINVNANDIATMGAIPKWFLATVLLPPGVTEDLVEEVFSSIHRAASSLGISICGGHTEVTHGLERPVVIGQMLGEVERDGLVRSSGAKVGDELLLTKGLAVEATSIIAREKEDELLASYGGEFVKRCRDFLYEPGIGVLKEARIACESAKVHAMHDPTEGGIATGLYELAYASGVGLEIDAEGLFLHDESRLLCDRFGLDPLGVISSGALLIVLDSKDARQVRNRIEKEGIRCDRIGRVREKTFGLRLRQGERLVDLPRFERDEITKLF
ncbi:MAG TPA: hydrogenase expression/formation protein [Candidatus Latescibacteria bacterium]|nr:hydrogenase expression/formation protein [Candidatus Latescibacterota bacterium]